MEIEIQKNILKELNKISSLSGMQYNELINRALLVYLINIKENQSLKQEMDDWDNLSDEALINFEKQL